jgi:hypothetical protein
MAEVIFIKVCNANLITTGKIEERIAKIDEIIDSLYNVALATVSQGNIAEYELDTGQTRNRVKYNSQASVMSAIKLYEDMRQRYVNRLQPRMVRLMDQKNFKR